MARYLLPTHPPGFLDVIPDEIKEDGGYELPMFRNLDKSEQGELSDSLNGRVLIMEGRHNINENDGFSASNLRKYMILGLSSLLRNSDEDLELILHLRKGTKTELWSIQHFDNMDDLTKV